MALFAIAAPILPGKTEQWKRFRDELTGPRYNEYHASRQKMGVRERAFLQSTPMGDIVIVTLEGDDPEQAFLQFGAGSDPFARWFVDQVKEIHGFDLAHLDRSQLSQLGVDSDSGGMQQKRAA